MRNLLRMTSVLAIGIGFGPGLAGCDQAASANVNVEKLPDVTPSLPPVPTLPPPPHPVQYDDQTYSVYGVRRAIRRTISTEVELTGYIAEVYQPPECALEKNKKKRKKRKKMGEKCPVPPAPHMFLADTAEETDKSKMLLVAGYAENQIQLDEALKDAKRGRTEAPPEDSGLLPIPTDFFKGAKIKIKGRFAYMAGSGFQSSEGVLDYGGHETLQPSADDPVANKRRR